jgi:hypothetical protein
MIIGDTGLATDRAGTSTFNLMSSDGTQELSFTLPDVLIPDFRAALSAQNFRIPEGAARSLVAEVIVATAANPAAWTAVGGMVLAFLRRHRGKVHRFEVEGRPVSIEGYSARDAERLAADLLALSRKRGDRGGHGDFDLGGRA